MRRLLFAAGLAAACHAAACHAAPAAALEAVCLPDHTIISAGERVIVRALSNAPPAASVTVVWSADAGEISSASDAAAIGWRPAEQAGLFSITAHVTAAGKTATCNAQVVVIQSPHRGLRPDRATADSIVAAISFLAPAAPEPPGYGLYSYVLFARRPQTDEERQRMVAVLDATLQLGDPDAMERAGVARSHLNATFLPIRQTLPDDFDQRDDRASWLRNNYGYEQALALLLKLQDASGHASPPSSTVWLVSCLQPLGSAADPRPVLVQDLSGVPVRTIPLWMARYAAVTTQPRLYDRHSLANLSLDLRIAIAQASDGMESVRGAFKLIGSSVLE